MDKGLGKNPQKSELIHWRQCLLSGGTEACSLGVDTSSHICHSHEWRVDTVTDKTLKKTECVLRRVKKIKLRV